MVITLSPKLFNILLQFSELEHNWKKNEFKPQSGCSKSFLIAAVVIKNVLYFYCHWRQTINPRALKNIIHTPNNLLN